MGVWVGSVSPPPSLLEGSEGCILAVSLGGSGGDTEGPSGSLLHNGDIFDPDIDMFGDVAGEDVVKN